MTLDRSDPKLPARFSCIVSHTSLPRRTEGVFRQGEDSLPVLPDHFEPGLPTHLREIYSSKEQTRDEMTDPVF